jgi:beta-glucosidase
MKLKNYFATFLFSCVCSIGAVAITNATQKEIESKVETTLSKMTLEEKVGQMVNIGLPTILKGDYWDARDTAIIDTARLAYFVGKYGIGSVHNKPGYPASNKEWYRLVKQIQDYALKHTRLGIPVIYGIDDINGANYVMGSTMMPHQIALAATWNPIMAYTAGEITSYESRSASLPWNYNPNLDVATQPLWGRISESFGEDPYLVSQMGIAYTQGSQNGGLNKRTNTAVCIKHFLGYGAGTNGKDRANALIPENYLRQYFIPPFKAAIDSGAMSIMISSNSVNGVPCHSNHFYLTDILKGELGFKGIVVSDFSDVEFLMAAHLTAANMREATKQSINAGLDMAMNPYDAKIADIIIDLVKSGEIPMSRIDDATRRILRVKYALNLFEVPYNSPKDYPKFACAEFINNNFEAACEAITLLKNDGILPLAKNKKVLVTGYSGNSINNLNGAWSRSFLGQSTKFNDPSKQTIYDAVKKIVGAENVTFVQGTDYLKDINSDEAVSKAQNADYIVVCIGEIPATEKPSDINELPIPDVQQDLVKKLAKTGKPIILVLVEGRPRIIREIEPLAKGIIMAYQPGDEGGRAIGAILFGDKNPSGKLPYTYPKYTGNTLTYWHKKTDIRDVNWGYDGFYPQFEFGYGLSYAAFSYSDLKLSTDKLTGEANLTISIVVKNTSKIAGKEVVECYIKDMVASVSPDVMKLVRFSKIELQAGESKTVSFTINKDNLGFVGIDNKWITEPGEFKVLVGGNPKEFKEAGFVYSK